MNIGFNMSLLSFGSGLLVGFRICLAMAIGTAISWFILPALSVLARNDSCAYVSDDSALGDVAGDGIDGCRRTDFAGAEVESDRQNISRVKGQQDGRAMTFPCSGLSIGSIVMSDRDLSGAILQHGHSGLSFVHCDPVVSAVDAGGLARAGRDKLGADQRDVEHDAGGLRLHLAGQCSGQHVFERIDRHDRGDVRSVDAGLQSRAIDRFESTQPDDRATHRRASWINCDSDRLSGAARSDLASARRVCRRRSA